MAANKGKTAGSEPYLLIHSNKQNTMMNPKYFLYNLLLLFVVSSASAQKTGLFTEDISFNAESRTLACYVPTDYDSTKQYRLMVALHGLGDNAVNFRSALINSLKWNNIFDSTIFICPDGGSDQNKDFYTPQGDEKIIDIAIGFASDNYKINSEEIILEGFSLGGRSALRYGLDNPDKFKALLLNTPALQGIDDLNNHPAINFPIAYQKANLLPVFISVGQQDYTYLYTMKKLYEKLIINDAHLMYHEVKSMGHSIPSDGSISSARDFFNGQNTQNTDVELSLIQTDQLNCGTNTTARCLVRNVGKNTISKLELNYMADSKNGSANWSGEMKAFGHAIIDLPLQDLPNGGERLAASLTKVNDKPGDDNAVNDTVSNEIIINATALQLPIEEGFEDKNPQWQTNHSGTIFKWSRDNSSGHNSSTAMSMVNTILFFYTMGDRESFYSPAVDLSSLSKPSVAFDLAYNYQKYTQPYFTQDVFFADTLEISISTDCGETFTTLFRKGGADLATFDEPILNPLNINQCYVVPGENNWKRIALDLSDYKNSSNAVLRFTCVSANGGLTVIDNVQFDNALAVPHVANHNKVTVFPNPANNYITLQSNLQKPTVVKLYNTTGQVVFSQNVGNELRIETSGFENGLYLLEIPLEEGTEYHKILIQH
ncbi:T9SS type A sorting domain-containing protein [bacterium]|nr:T9SS type A sorting domain-containing protein [bacterium]